MTIDDDKLTGLPDEPDVDPDAEATAAELEAARSFGDLVEQAIAGRAPGDHAGPALMTSDDRALLEVATLIRATHGRADLAETTTRSLVDDVLRGAMGAGAVAPVISLTARRAAKKNRLPWSIAAVTSLVAAAAIAVLALRGPHRVVEVAQARPPIEWTSRPTDRLVGKIEPAAAAAADSRIDAIFDDRLDGYRDRSLSRGARP